MGLLCKIESVMVHPPHPDCHLMMGIVRARVKDIDVLCALVCAYVLLP